MRWSGSRRAAPRRWAFALNDEDRQRPYVEVSGRKGQGVKADDLIDTLIARAAAEVSSRNMAQDPDEVQDYARKIAVAALRYFLLKFSRRMIIAFDFKEALAFEGETGPYLQYSIVRARNIIRKFQEARPDFEPANLSSAISPRTIAGVFQGSRWPGVLGTHTSGRPTGDDGGTGHQ